MPTLSLDFTQMLANAFDIVNKLWPVFALPLGLILGFALLDKIIKAVKGAFSHS